MLAVPMRFMEGCEFREEFAMNMANLVLCLVPFSPLYLSQSY
jgi:hypothetical protein